jgi:hypothetical protein
VNLVTITDELRLHAVALENLPERLAPFRNRAEAAESPGSPMFQARNELRARGAPGEELVVDARVRALHALDACSEHVQAIARLLLPSERYYSAQVLVRTVMESAGLVRWMLDAYPADLVSRHLGRARDEQDRALAFLQAAEVSSSEDQQRLEKIKVNIIAMKERTLKAVADLGIKPTQIGPTALARFGGESSEYDIYSGSTHGRLGSFLETRTMASDEVGNAILFMNLISVAAPAYVSATESLHRFVTGEMLPDDLLGELADSLGLTVAAIRLT